MMGRKRKSNKHLPPRMRLSRGAYYLDATVDGKRKWIPLGKDFAEAMVKYVEHEGINRTGSTVKDAIDRYQLEILPTLAAKTQDERTRQSDRLKSVFGHMRLQSVKPHHIAAYILPVFSGISACFSELLTSIVGSFSPTPGGAG